MADIYKIVSVLSGKVAAVAGESSVPPPIIEYPYGGATSQQWELVPVGNGRVEIRSVGTGQAIAVSAGSGNPRPLIAFPYSGAASQQWQIEPIAGNFFKMIVQSSGQVIAVSDASRQAATPLVQWGYTGDNSQKWAVEWLDTTQGRCKIVSLLSGQVMAVANASKDAGAYLIQYPYSGGTSQEWRLVPVDGDLYKIESCQATPTVLVVTATDQRQPGLLTLEPYTGATTQHWKLEALQLSKIVSCQDPKQVMAVAGASKDNARLIQYPYDGDSSQQWELTLLSADPMTLDQVRQAIGRYGPILRLHPRENYRMCSIDWFLQHASLYDSVTKKTVVHPKAGDLPVGPHDGTRYWLNLEDGGKGGCQTTAKAYVRVYGPAGQTHTDIQFWFFYAYNGPGTLHISDLVSEGDANVGPVGEHIGDWENCILRIDNKSGELIGVWLSQHESGEYFDGNSLDRFQRVGEQVVVYASLNGHAVYSGVGPNPTNESDYKLVSWYLRNDTDENGLSLDCSKTYEFISAPTVTEPRWVDYPCRWGPALTPDNEISYGHAVNVVTAALDKFAWLGGGVVGFIGALVVQQILPMVYRDDKDGPVGPKQKDEWNGDYH